MIEVTVLAQRADGRFRAACVGRKYSWPTVPRVGEVLQLHEALFARVEMVSHVLNDEFQGIFLHVLLTRSAFERLRADSAWFVYDFATSSAGKGASKKRK